MKHDVQRVTLPLTRDRVLLLLEALSRHEEHCDTMGCVRETRACRQLLGELRQRMREMEP